MKGACIITHGSANNNAVKNSIRVAAEFATRNVMARIEKELAASGGKPRHTAAKESHARIHS